jgi:formamidopyrimidine-DNA glycosylase
MPEMPEVETMVSRLQKYVGQDVWYVAPADGEDPDRYADRDFAPPQKLGGVFRRGKFMVFMLEDCALLCHNAMSGYWDELDDPWTFDYVEGKRKSSETDIRALVNVGTSLLQFHDARKFGSLRVVSPEELATKLSALGPEAASSKHLYEPTAVITEAQFAAAMNRGKKKAVKEVLMSQEKIAGVGNIYAAEACWAAKVDPFRLASSLSPTETTDLFCAVRSVMEGAIERSLNYDGLKIYRRKECPLDKTPVKTAKLKGRATYWCPACQR